MRAGGRWLAGAVGLAAAGIAAAAARAAEVEIALPPPGGEGWQALRFEKAERETEYRAGEEEGLPALRASSRCSASALVHRVSGVDLGRTPRLAWRWKVVEPLAATDERVRGGDDFAARVYVLFPFDPAAAGLGERLRRRLGERLFGRSLPGAALNYVWSSREPPGARWDNPYAAESKMIAVERGAASGFRRVEADLPADYAALFGRPPPPPLAVALMSDSDDGCGHAVAWFADFRFLGAGAEGPP
jgi:hypothetical protein